MGEPEGMAMEIIEAEEQEAKKIEKKVNRACKTTKQASICIVRVPEEERRERGR